MIRLIAIFFLLLLASGCSDSNDGGPDITEAHPDKFIFTHPEPAREGPDRCRSCHGVNFEGAVGVIGCTACHPFGLNPQAGGFFSVHPLSWGTTREAIIQNHDTFPLSFNWTTCANAACHGATLQGGETGPGCFTAGCHEQLSTSPHPVPPEQPFALPQFHGPLARDLESYCFNCHGRPPTTFDGGYIADPAILRKPAGNCSICHPDAQAHPTNWQGSNDPDLTVYASSHRAVDELGIQEGCSLCHDIANTGVNPDAGAPSCFSAQFTNSDGSTTGCHPGGPD